MDIKAIFFDVDSTLTAGVGLPVVESAVEAIKQLQEKGIKIIIASGRMPYGIKAIEGKIIPDYYIGANGQIVTDSKGNVVDISLIDKDTFDSVTKYCKKRSLGLFWKFADACFIYNEFDSMETISSTTSRLYSYENPDKNELPTSGALICPKEEMLKIKDLYRDKLDVIDGGYLLYDLDKKGKSKKDGLIAIGKKFNISLDQMMAFGDSNNDIEMLKAAGLSVAMGNGYQSAKDVADYVTDTAANDGILKALKKFEIL